MVSFSGLQALDTSIDRAKGTRSKPENRNPSTDRRITRIPKHSRSLRRSLVFPCLSPHHLVTDSHPSLIVSLAPIVWNRPFSCSPTCASFESSPSRVSPPPFSLLEFELELARRLHRTCRHPSLSPTSFIPFCIKGLIRSRNSVFAGSPTTRQKALGTHTQKHTPYPPLDTSHSTS